MQPSSTNNGNKRNGTASSTAKKPSCSHGWLHLAVQYVFGAITVISFILIVCMTTTPRRPRPEPDHCVIHGCRVMCDRAPDLEKHEDDVILAVSEAELRCESVILTLNEPLFINSTIPPFWMPRMLSNVHELEIVGGNMNNIAPQAFMSQFATQMYRLTLEYVTIRDWSPDMLVGLAHLKELHIKNSNIQRIEKNALQAVDNTLETLAITWSNYWDPANLTGQANLISLSNVVLSSNNFNNILHRRSFKRLQKCKVLFLNSCRINAIGSGTFDNLESIEMLYLHDNLLVMMPPTLFDSILAITFPRPRINLQDNKWVCDCAAVDTMRRLVDSEMLLVDPTCHYPESTRGRTFKQFVKYCENNTNNRSIIVTNRYQNDFDVVHMDGACQTEVTGRRSVTLISPADFLTCSHGNHVDFLNALPDKALVTDRPLKNEVINVTFSMRGDRFSIVEITSTAKSDYGLVWYQTRCPLEVYCVNILPSYLTVYNVDLNTEYTFCPLNLTTQTIDANRCVFCNPVGLQGRKLIAVRITMLFVIGVSCLAFGALCVYLIIWKFPHLLKGSNRVLFVKHKDVDALILPPKIPLRNSDSNLDMSKTNIFTLSSDKKELLPKTPFIRMQSIRSTNSTAPSYISALQPTEEQLKEWRLKHLDDNDSIITSFTFGYPYVKASDNESLYCSISNTSTKTLESMILSEFCNNNTYI